MHDSRYWGICKHGWYLYEDGCDECNEEYTKEQRMNLRPLGTRIWVEPVTEKAEKIGSLYVPDNKIEKPVCGKVKAIGDEVKKVKVGDKVYYGRYAGTNLEVNQAVLLFIKEEDIIAVEET
jgi:chaperonin GroES